MAPVILYGVKRSPPTQAVLVTAKAVGVEIELKIIELARGEHKSESFLKKNPAHTIPTLEDNGVIIWESRAIMGYLVQKYGKDDKLYPREAVQRALVDNILYFEAASLYKNFFDYYRAKIFTKEPPNEQKLEEAKDNMSTLEKILGNNRYVAGDHLTIADISMVTSLSSLPIFGFSLDAYPKSAAYRDRLRKEIPSYEETVKSGEEDLTAFIKAILSSKQ